MKIKVMIVDDQVLLAEGIRSVLASSGELEVVSVAHDGQEALDMMQENLPDVVLLDIRMPNMNGVVTTGEIKKRYPQVKVLMLTTFDDSDYILSALNNGACGYLLKDISSAALIEAIKNAYAGDTILPAKIAKKVSDAAKMVTSDRDIRLRLAFGLSEREVYIAVMTFDDYPFSQQTVPPLTTVNIDVRDMGAQAAELLLSVLRHPNKQVQTYITTFNLIERESTAR